ncbi:hypothetical protein GCM10027422_14600 [Hymenobacter arcticus]
MEFARYIESTLPDMQRAPIDTVIEFIEVYNKWAKDCHRLVKVDEANLKELAKTNSTARKVLQEIYEKYCTSKNRQYHRVSTGYFFYGGTYNSSCEIESCIEVEKNKMEVQTKKIKNISQVKKYTVIRQGRIWKIDTVESLAGNNRWVFDIM